MSKNELKMEPVMQLKLVNTIKVRRAIVSVVDDGLLKVGPLSPALSGAAPGAPSVGGGLLVSHLLTQPFLQPFFVKRERSYFFSDERSNSDQTQKIANDGLAVFRLFLFFLSLSLPLSPSLSGGGGKLGPDFSLDTGRPGGDVPLGLGGGLLLRLQPTQRAPVPGGHRGGQDPQVLQGVQRAVPRDVRGAQHGRLHSSVSNL